MADDLYDAFGDDDIFMDEEEDIVEEAEIETDAEGQNRTFMIAVGVLGGLLVLAMVGAAVFFLVINPGRQAQPLPPGVDESPTTELLAADITATAVAVAEAGIEEVEGEPGEEVAEEVEEPTATPTDTPEPTNTPTATPVIGPTNTPVPEEEEGEEIEEGEMTGAGMVDEGEEAEEDVTPTPELASRRTPTPTPSSTPTRTPRPTPTPSKVSKTETTPETGLGEVLLVLLAGLLLGVLFISRRARKA